MARAQTPNGVAGLLPNLILNGIRLDAGTPVPHDAHFTPLNELYVGTDPHSGRTFQVDAAEVVLNFNRLLATQFATFPPRELQRRLLVPAPTRPPACPYATPAASARPSVNGR